jgi:NarL family two-component system sensor histidine kinase YdfH
MKSISSRLRSKFKKFPELWFFVFANFVFVIMFIWSLMITPELLLPLQFILFTFLTLVHIAAHWSLLLVNENERWFWPYIVIQGLLAFAIVQMSQNIGMTFALYMALIGEVIGTKGVKSRTIIAVAFFLTLSLINHLLLVGVADLRWWLLGTIMSVFFVVLYVSLFTAESEARTRAQSLLAELETTHSQLTEYATQVEELTLTTERQRMARELHDTLAQGLAGLILQLEAADAHINNQNPQKAQAIVQQAMSRARTTLADARRAISDLREAPPTPTDLNEAIKADVERFQASTGIPCTLGFCQPPSVSPLLAENILRAINEGLMNIARHAEASEVILTMKCDHDKILIELQDDGIGFDPAEAVGRSGHFGLVGMRERTRLYGGSLTIESQPAQGTTLTIQLPLMDGEPVTND